MTSNMISCSLCGHTFNPAEHPSCSTCPLHSGCQIACCPNCGMNNINPDGSTLVRLVKALKGALTNHDKRPGALV